MTQKIIPYSALLQVFWQGHNPTQGMRQGNDRGTQYRSGIYTYSPAQETEAQTSKTMYQNELNAAQHGMITTEILPAEPFYYAEDYHQQYLAKKPCPATKRLGTSDVRHGVFLGGWNGYFCKRRVFLSLPLAILVGRLRTPRIKRFARGKPPITKLFG